MTFYLEPSLDITNISSSKIQLSHCSHVITLENQNENLQNFLTLIENKEFPDCLDGREDSDILHELFNFFVKHHFLLQDPSPNLDSLFLDLNVQNKALIPNFDTTHPKCVQHIDMSTINVFGEGILFERVIDELSKQNFLVNTNPLPETVNNEMLLCCADKENDKLFTYINRLSHKKMVPVLFAQLRSNVALIGPLVVPEETSCYSCYSHRVAPNLNFVAEEEAIRLNKGNIHSNKSVPSLYALEATFHVVSQVLKFQSKAFHLCLINEVLEVNLLDYQLDVRPIMRVPHCKVCYSQRNALPKNAVRALI